MNTTQEPEESQELATTAISPRKGTATSVQQTLLLLLGFAAVLAGLVFYSILFLRAGSWLLGRH